MLGKIISVPLHLRDDVEDEEVEVYIYTTYCGQVYHSNDFDPDSRDFYKNLVIRLMDKL